MKMKDIIKENRIVDYLKYEKNTIEKLLVKMPIHQFLLGLERDIINHTGIKPNHEKLKDNIIDIFFGGVEPEFKDDKSYKEWEDF